MDKVGVFGGTFDPPHLGHVFLAKQAAAEYMLKHVFIVPVNEQPCKQGKEAAPATHRFSMAKLAFEGEANMSVSDIELKKGGVSYTIDTLREIRERFCGKAAVAFILGADAFLKIQKWKNSDELLKEFIIIVGARPGQRQAGLEEYIRRLAYSNGARVLIVENRQIPVSSTEIKEMIKSGGEYSRFVPAEVVRYIESNGLYLGVH